MRDKRYKSSAARSAFTLLELMVSVAILLAVLALIGTIFATASKAGGNATAITTVYRQLRQAAEIIRQDLAAMDPARDAMGIARPLGDVTAISDRRTKAIGSHRADVLMLYTARRDTRPYITPLGVVDPDAFLDGTMQVVYGHADFGALNPNTGAMIVTQAIEDSPTPTAAYDWHVARRVLLFPAMLPNYRVWADLTQPEFLYGQMDVMPATIPNWDMPEGHYRYHRGNLLEAYYKAGSEGFVSFGTGAFSLYYDGNRWFRRDGALWIRSEINPSLPIPGIPTIAEPAIANLQGNNGLAGSLFYDDLHSGPRRTVLDPTPPGSQPGGMAHHFLPNCSDLRVEFTYDDPREVFRGAPADIDPLDPAGESLPVGDYVRPVWWQSVPAGQQFVWSKLSASPVDRTHPYRWPTAIRITLRAWDSAGRLDEPVTHTLIHTWPSGD